MNLDRLVQLEKRLAELFDRRLRREHVPYDALELVPLVLDHIEEHIRPVPGGGRVFPYERVTVRVFVGEGETAAAQAVLEARALEKRVRERLSQGRCVPPDGFGVAVKIVEGEPPASYGSVPFKIDYRARTRRTEAEPPRPATPAVRFTVLAGTAGGRSHAFSLERINVGRVRRIEGGRGAARQNHLVFADDGGEINGTVSRAHAHFTWDAELGGYRLFDDGSVHGTRVFRSGRDLAVPRQGSRGVRLEHGDELEFGRARVRYLTRWPEGDEGRAPGAPSARSASARRQHDDEGGDDGAGPRTEPRRSR